MSASTLETPPFRDRLPLIGRARNGTLGSAALFLAVLLAGPLSAQYQPEPPLGVLAPGDAGRVWGQGPRLSLGVGQGTEGFAMLGVASLVAGPGDAMVRLANTGLLERTVGDMAFLYGLRAATPGGRLSGRIGAGLGWVDQAYDGPKYNCRTEQNVVGLPPLIVIGWESTECDQDRIENSGLGLALQLDTTVGVTAEWGLSLSWFGSLGGPQGYHGFAVSFLRAF